LTVSLHQVAKASSPVTQPPKPRAIDPTNRAPSLDARCSKAPDVQRNTAALTVATRRTTKFPLPPI
jgi:hypothetical protein